MFCFWCVVDVCCQCVCLSDVVCCVFLVYHSVVCLLGWFSCIVLFFLSCFFVVNVGFGLVCLLLFWDVCFMCFKSNVWFALLVC